ncbi:bifunctional ADP-dependent NAD(P)H-hydrate dehydratase/NAD(P)H-hydrate epimerase [Corynebacterium sp. AOP40-9SA-29]|uniref:bifunctional ADP-dependent NAD(P)H-hydrate dehydratase/NAD(P)H-hydrate epimerase n=1 Tax=Corynebacterium sp. AOP40-9SA-29 TaxID=3457677 RepID=UPI0040343BDE
MSQQEASPRNYEVPSGLQGEVFTVEEVRAAERPLLEAQDEPDALMRSAASAVAQAARVMLARDNLLSADDRVLVAAGGGGNGGDALYAAAELAAEGWAVDAVLFGRDGRVHRPALDAFLAAGGTVVELDSVWHRPSRHRLLIDGVLGIGGDGGLSQGPAVLFAYAAAWFVPVLAVDVPSGIAADTGATPAMIDVEDPPDPRAEEWNMPGMTVLMRTRVPAHVIADVTVTFGGLRRAHAVSAYCGQVLLADAGLDPERTISAGLSGTVRDRARLSVSIGRAVTPECERPMDEEYDIAETLLTGIGRVHADGAHEPGPYDDKYSGGVVGVCAGSAEYPGAGVLTTTAAVRTTSSMVRYVGLGGGDAAQTAAAEVVRACPEVVWSPDVARTGRVQAWVAGPGRGTGEDAAGELAELIARPEPLVLDADAITLLAGHDDVRTALQGRALRDEAPAATLLTPHDGEFRRLAEMFSGIPDPEDDRIGAVVALSDALNCAVLLKGRRTLITDGRSVSCIDAGSSWGATPGSGDVLSGILGALAAESEAKFGDEAIAAKGHPSLPDDGDGRRPRWNGAFPAYGAVALHAVAAELSARTPAGHASTSASRIAEAIPHAVASCAPAVRTRHY